VARKLTMMEVVEGKQPKFQSILRVAQQEINEPDQSKGEIGFAKK